MSNRSFRLCPAIAIAILLTLTLFTPLGAAAADAPSLTWVQLTPPNSPPARGAAAMAYDPVSKRIVLFGGTTATKYLNDTWTFDGTTWTQVNTPVAPPARASGMMAYDFPTRKLVMFGGFDSDYLGDTWIFDGATQTWTQANPLKSPGPLGGCLLFTDPKNGRVDLFGGFNHNRKVRYPIDTWRWTGTSWRKLHPATSPEGRSSGAVGNDPARKNVVISGGLGDLMTENTWTWDGSDWTEQVPVTQMPYVFYTSTAYAPPFQAVLVFGGDEVTGAENTTWAWTGSDWIQLQPLQSPPVRDSPAMAYDFASRQLIMFGGAGLEAYLNDTWKLTRP